MSDKYKFKNKNGLYFITLTVQHWVDVFSRLDYRIIIVESLEYCQSNKGLEIFAWVIMSNHLHLIVRAVEGFSIEDIMRDFKKFTSKEIVKAIAENIQESRREWLLRCFKDGGNIRFWQEGNHPIELWSNEVIAEKLNYIHQNPVCAGIVFQPHEYVYSSAVDYAGERGLLTVRLLDI
jgi:REP element-mobilizing transposase RayT